MNDEIKQELAAIKAQIAELEVACRDAIDTLDMVAKSGTSMSRDHCYYNMTEAGKSRDLLRKALGEKK